MFIQEHSSIVTVFLSLTHSHGIKTGKREAYLSNARVNSPGTCGQDTVSLVMVSVQDGEDATVVKNQKDIQSSRGVVSVPEL